MRGPNHSQKKGKTPVLTAEEARDLVDSIKIVKKTRLARGAVSERPNLLGLGPAHRRDAVGILREKRAAKSTIRCG